MHAPLCLANDLDKDFKLVFDRPADNWNEALPVGNGRMGAMVFGGVEDEHLQVNESTLWGGGPHDYVNPDAHAHLSEMRSLIFSGNIEAADTLAESMMGSPRVLMPYQPFCDIHLHFPGYGQVSGYHRELNLNGATAITNYQIGRVRFTREVFISYPDQVLVVHLSADQPAQLNLDVAIDSPQRGAQTESSEDTLRLDGQIEARQNPPASWTGSWQQPGLRFAAVLQALPQGGSIRQSGGQLHIRNANSVTLLFSNATSFVNFRDVSGDAQGAAQAHLERAGRRSYESLRMRHRADFGKLFSRVQLHLGNDQSSASIDRRIQQFHETEDPALLALYFEFGRYLLICASRPGGQAANLQGIWNQDLLPAWGSKWTTNINLQMNYWQADVDDLWETQQPLWNLIQDLRITGAQTARVEYQSHGWVLHHNTDIWRASAPVDGSWGLWPMGAVWLANQMWDHYEYSQDETFLLHQAYPAMKDAASFVLDNLVEAPAATPFAGKLVTNPSTSPENHFLLAGQAHDLTYAATMDIELITELFEHCQRAAQILGMDAILSDQLREALTRLPPLQVGSRGQLQEWIEDYEEAEPQHRHVSHLYSLFPGHNIGLKTTPKLAAAAQRSLELRGDGGTGWSTVWRVALWARLANAERAYNNLKLLINNSTLPNMFDWCPPFQIDGNLGGPAAISEMLVQSSEHDIVVLPALPAEWPRGELKGVRVRGGGKLDVIWKEGRLSQLKLWSARARTYRIEYGRASAEIKLEAGKPLLLNGALRRTG